MSDAEIILSAAEELAKLITEKNLELMANVSSSDLDMPDLHDFQTCHELHEIGRKLKLKSPFNTTEER